MAAVLALLFLVVPLVELLVIIQVGQAVGAVETVGLLLVMSVAGGWLMKREGLGIVRRIQQLVAAGQVPGRELVDAFLVLFGGALMLTPGFLTDLLGLSLLLPPVRAVVRRLAAARLTVMAVGATTGGRPPGPRGWRDPGDPGGPSGVIDV